MSASDAGEWPSDVQLLLGQLSDDPAGTMHDLLDTSAFASDATESERLGARQHIIARLADIMEHVSSYDRKDRAAAQRLVDALWPAGTGAASELCAPYMDSILGSLSHESVPATPGPEAPLSTWVKFVVGAAGPEGIVECLGSPNPHGFEYPFEASKILKHLGPAVLEEHAGTLIMYLGDPDMNYEDHYDSHDRITRLLQSLDPDVLASHASDLMANLCTAQRWAARDCFVEVLGELELQTQEMVVVPMLSVMGTHDHPNIRGNALCVLEALDPVLRDRTCRKIVLDGINDPIASVRACAMCALQNFETPLLLAHARKISMLLMDSDLEVRLAAIETLSRLEPHSLEPYAAAIAGCVADPFERESAWALQVRALGTLRRIGPHMLERHLPLIVMALKETLNKPCDEYYLRVRSCCLECMQELPGSQVLAPHAALIAKLCRDDQSLATIWEALKLFEKLPLSLQLEQVHAIQAVLQLDVRALSHMLHQQYADGVPKRAERIMEQLFAPGGPGFLQAQADFQSHA